MRRKAPRRGDAVDELLALGQFLSLAALTAVALYLAFGR